MPSTPFHVTIHARAAEVAPAGLIALAGHDYPTLDVPAAALSAPFDRSFEAVGEALTGLDRMYLEPDGSFVWVSSAGEPPWQLDGVLYDRAGRLLYVELKGRCPHGPFEQLLAALGWPDTLVMFQLVREAVFLDESCFRRYAGFS